MNKQDKQELDPLFEQMKQSWETLLNSHRFREPISQLEKATKTHIGNLQAYSTRVKMIEWRQGS